MASVKKFLNDLTGQEAEREKAKKEAASLVQLAQSKLDNLENEMRELFRNKELEAQVQIVGDRMGAFSREYRVNYADGDVSNAVQELVNQIMSIGSEKAGAIISKAITNSLSAMFSSVNVQEESKRLFVVLLEGVAMVRYDIWVWKSAEQDQALFQHTQSVVAITYARSVVDHTKLSEDELNDGIFRSLGGASVKEVIEYKRELMELFNLSAGNALPVQNAALRTAPARNAALRAVPAGSPAPEEDSLDRELLDRLRAVAPLAAAQPAPRPAPVSPEIQELLTLDPGAYHAK